MPTKEIVLKVNLPVMIDNNLCFDIALYPYELVTYGETGQVCQNWMQYRLIKQYLEVLTRIRHLSLKVDIHWDCSVLSPMHHA